ncbi:MAG: FliH/SctL family protein [Deltaproteobacteria bacterium]|nr:FliH/SctL family protein [Deltaproteobacteria bacterium]
MSKVYKYAAGLTHTPLVMETLGSDDVFPRRGNNDAKVGTGLEALEREAYEKGFRAGEKAGFEFGRQKAEVLFSGLAKIIEEIAAYKERLYKPCVREMTELSLAMARKVVQRELELQNDTVLTCVSAALKSVVAGGDITIKVNPTDLELIRQNKGELLKYGDGIKSVSIEGSDDISRGGCLIDTRFGEVDATVDSVMEEFEERLRDAH